MVAYYTQQVGGMGWEEDIIKGHKENLGGDGMFIILIEVMVSELYTYVKPYHTEHFKCSLNR